jgi:Tic20 family protein import component
MASSAVVMQTGSLSQVLVSRGRIGMRASVCSAARCGVVRRLDSAVVRAPGFCGNGLGSVESSFRGGEGGLVRVREGEERRGRGRGGVRAAAEDVPSFKGFAPMQEKPKFWWRILACVPYLMPLSETWMYAETAYSLHAFLEDYEFCTYPFLILIGSLPSWFLLAYFFGAYLGVVRNNRWPHFLRFHVVTGMLLEIIVQVIGTVNDWVPQALYWGKFGAHYWLAISFAFLFIVIDCIRCALSGMYADVPFLSDASYMQIPYE